MIALYRTLWVSQNKKEAIDDFEELFLGDLIGRLVDKHDLSSVEMKKLNLTLAALKQQAPFALLRVFLHYTRTNARLLVHPALCLSLVMPVSYRKARLA
jgi:hypothetical protein